VSYPILQPVLLASRKSCPRKGNYYLQAGDHHFRFSIQPHAGGWQNGWRQGVGANVPLIAVTGQAAADAVLPEQMSFCSTTADNIMITALKKCEDDDQVVLRCVDMLGRDSQPRFEFFRPVIGAEQTNLIEEEGQPVPVQNGQFQLKVGHHAIETVKFQMQQKN